MNVPTQGMVCFMRSSDWLTPPNNFGLIRRYNLSWLQSLPHASSPNCITKISLFFFLQWLFLPLSIKLWITPIKVSPVLPTDVIGLLVSYLNSLLLEQSVEDIMLINKDTAGWSKVLILPQGMQNGNLFVSIPFFITILTNQKLFLPKVYL